MWTDQSLQVVGEASSLSTVYGLDSGTAGSRLELLHKSAHLTRRVLLVGLSKACSSLRPLLFKALAVEFSGSCCETLREGTSRLHRVMQTPSRNGSNMYAACKLFKKDCKRGRRSNKP